METQTGQTRLYVIVGTMLGLMIGVFMQSTLDQEAGAFRIAGLLICGAIGGVMGKLLLLAQSPEDDDTIPPEDPLPDDPDVSATRFFKLQSGVFTDEELRQLRVRSVTMPMSPPDSEVPLQVGDYDSYARVSVIEGVLPRLTVREIAERALAEAEAKAPKVPGDLALKLVSYNSEGPLGPDGRCPLGWTFAFVDGDHGLGCRATATEREIALHFHTAATFSEPAEWEWIEMDDLLKWVETALPEWGGEDVYVRVNLADDYLPYVRHPIRIADLDVGTGTVRNLEFLGREHDDPDEERIELSELLDWFRDGDAEGDLSTALETPGLANGLRTLDPGAIRRVAEALERQAGPAIVSRVADAAAAAEDAAERAELLHLLAYLPAGLSPVVLHRLSMESELAEVREIATELHRRWRRNEIDVPNHPLDSLSFLESRRRMGRGNLVVIPLLSTYDPEGELLPVLEELGFRIRRRRMLSGDSKLIVGVHFRAEEGETELVLTSTPLPMPCHVLHIVGGNAEKVADRVRRSTINYPRSTIFSDAHSGRPSRVHRAALYIAALRIDETHLTDHLITALERARSNDAIRRAALSALAVQSDPRAIERLRSIASDPEDPDRDHAATLISEGGLTGSVPSV